MYGSSILTEWGVVWGVSIMTGWGVACSMHQPIVPVTMDYEYMRYVRPTTKRYLRCNRNFVEDDFEAG